MSKTENKIEALKIRGDKCETCGYEHVVGFNTGVFEFHHTELIGGGHKPSIFTKKTWRQELLLGKMLCANCHRLEHIRVGWKTKTQLEK